MQVNCKLKVNEAKCFQQLLKNAITNRKKIIKFYKKLYNVNQNNVAKEKHKMQKQVLKDLKSIKHKILKQIRKPATPISFELIDCELKTLKQHFEFWINASEGDNGQKLAIALRDKIFEHKE